MTAVLLGSISVLADTSELQRRAFNEAFAAHGLDWTWEQETYRELLTSNGGQQRIADWAEQHGDDVDAEAVHETKTERFHALLLEERPQPRDGVRALLDEARARDVPVALVTTTSPDNVATLLDAMPDVHREDFQLVLDRSDVEDGKPSPEVFRVALKRLDRAADDCVAVEDNVGGTEAATGAGIACVAFPNENTGDHDFPTRRVQRLELDDLLDRTGQQR